MNGLMGQPARILVVLHQERSSAGRVGQLLEAGGFTLDICRPPMGDELPDNLDNHVGVVVFGGPMSANDPEPYISRETEWLKIPLRENKPFLGICLGAQMLVKHLGGKVATNSNGKVEIGWYGLRATEAGESLMSWPSMVYQFHREGFSLPSGAVLLASADEYPNQAFRYGPNAWAIQFHAELTRVMMHRWMVHGAHRFILPGAQNAEAHLQGRFLWDRDLYHWLAKFLHRVFPVPELSVRSTAPIQMTGTAQIREKMRP